MNVTHLVLGALAAALFALGSTIALADDGSTSTGSSSSSSTTTSTATTVVPLHFERRCPKSGTSVMDGSYDTVTGKISITSTVSACTMWNGEVQDGSTTVTGTLIPASGTLVNLDMTTVDTLTVTRNDNKVTNSCTFTKQGTFDQATHLFSGKNASSCALEGTVRDREGLVEYLLRRAGVLPSSTTSGSFATTK